MNVTTFPTFPNNSALGRGIRVTLSAGYLVAAGSSTDEIGVLDEAVLAGDTLAAVVPIDHPGVRYGVAAGAFAQYATLYAAASGKIDDSGSVIRGIALEAASGNNSLIRYLPQRSSITGNLARSALTQDDAAVYDIPLTSLRTWDALATNLPGTAADDDLALITGTPGTDAPTIQAGDIGGASSTRKASFELTLPPEYVDGETVTLRIHGGLLTTVCDGSCTVDVQAYEVAAAGSVGADICATAAQSMNSLTFANLDFTITPTGLAAGDRVMVVLSVAYADSGDLGAMTPELTSIKVLADIKG